MTDEAARRAAQAIVADGCVTRAREGRRNHYRIHHDAPLRHPLEDHHTVGDLLRALGRRRRGGRNAA